MGLAPTSFPILEQEIVRFTVEELYVVTSVLPQTNALALNSGLRDGLAYDLMNSGLIACTATDVHDALDRCPCGIQNEWGMSLLAVMAGEET